MSESSKSSLEKIVLGIAIASFAYTVVKAVVLIPRDVEDLRDRVAAIQNDHDLIQRIDERTAAMQRDIQDLKKRP